MGKNMETAQLPALNQAISFRLRQALRILQMPQSELAQFLSEEIEKNPLLEWDGNVRLQTSAPLTELEAKPSLQEHLLRQIRERFSSPFEQKQAAQLLQELDERGYLEPEVEDSPILFALQRFDPPGIFARSLKECLLLQIESDSSLFHLVKDCFEDLLKGRFEKIRKRTGIQDLAPLLQRLSKLRFRPAELFKTEIALFPSADLLLSEAEEGWTVEVKEEDLPKFHIRTEYKNLALQSLEEKENLREWTAAGKWLLRSLKRRKSILLTLGASLVKKQGDYLLQKGPLHPLTIQEMASQLNLSESTLSRALSGKYALTPRGQIPLRSLFLAAPEAQRAKDALREMVEREDKARPMSDGEIQKRLKSQGFDLARRTVAKYRTQLKIAHARLRKNRPT